MIHSKRGTELALNTIVVAAIVLIVFVVIILIFTGNIGKFFGWAQNCEEKGQDYKCKDKCGENEIEVKIGAKCQNEKDVCCIIK